jgi:hypothetical protein
MIAVSEKGEWMTDAATGLKRITRTYRQTINASPDEVFPLLCPVREAEWLDGWQYTMLFSESGIVEEGAVFTTPGDGEADTVWVVTWHDPDDYAVEFTRFTPGSRVCVLRIGVTPAAEGRSFVDVAYTYTSITAAGNAFLERFTGESFRAAVTFWEDSMNHWLETGERLTRVE